MYSLVHNRAPSIFNLCSVNVHALIIKKNPYKKAQATLYIHNILILGNEMNRN